jgi:thiol-disulfide isomerase/thioredoxin
MTFLTPLVAIFESLHARTLRRKVRCTLHGAFVLTRPSVESQMRVIRVCVAVLCLGVATSSAQTLPDLPELKSLRGQVVYLDFWASWCAPCRQSFPWMNVLQTRYAGRGLTVVAVNLDHERVDADLFLKRLPPDFQVRFDPQGNWARYFKVEGMPTSVILDRAGKPRFTHIGFNNRDTPVYEAQIQQLLSEP